MSTAKNDPTRIAISMTFTQVELETLHFVMDQFKTFLLEGEQPTEVIDPIIDKLVEGKSLARKTQAEYLLDRMVELGTMRTVINEDGEVAYEPVDNPNKNPETDK